MKKFLSFFAVMLAFVSISIALPGCGGAGGSAGDENDPETTDDVEQMEDESEDTGEGGAARPEGGAGGV